MQAPAPRALTGTAVASYTGIDFSALALELAAGNLATVGCPVNLIQGDFLAAVDGWRDPVDVVWIGLSLHHLLAPEKQVFMAKVRKILSPGGRLMVFENTSPDGEARDAWLARWDLQRPIGTHTPRMSGRG